MNYDKAELREIAMEMLKRCQALLKESGFLPCCAVAVDRRGLQGLIPLLFHTPEEKYEVKENLKQTLRAMDASAVVMMSEAWLSETLPTKGTPGYTGSLKDVPGRKEVIWVNAGSASAQVTIHQVFTRNEAEFVFQEPMEGDSVGEDSWLDGVWN
jgi:hypothetical protein